jgi:uncharacterized protein
VLQCDRLVHRDCGQAAGTRTSIIVKHAETGMQRDALSALVLGLLVAIGVAIGGYFVGDGLRQARSSERYVTVKGLSEREVKADLAIWPIQFAVTANDLTVLQKLAEDSERKIRAFLEKDFANESTTVSAPRVTDRDAQGMVDRTGTLARYTAEVTVTLRTSRIDAVREAIQRSGELVKQGVALVQNYEARTQYLFTGLEAIKPEMIAIATRDARRAAEQFAKDSGSEVGAIRNAQQGYFNIEDRDQFSPERKTVRVVTTVQFFLADD